ncbi:DUF454 family protein [Brucella sp. 21LCYQ03]|nr:DUF454 family protein [Brucella sp. 21LCYQ03]
MIVSDSTSSIYPDECQRAGYLALGLLLVVAALIGHKLPLMPSTFFAFCAMLCFMQLSPQILHWLQTNKSMVCVIDVWRALNNLPLTFRCCLLVFVVVIILLGLVVEPSMTALELVINGFLCSLLLIFMGPQRREMKFDTE